MWLFAALQVQFWELRKCAASPHTSSDSARIDSAALIQTASLPISEKVWQTHAGTQLFRPNGLFFFRILLREHFHQYNSNDRPEKSDEDNCFTNCLADRLNCTSTPTC
ncbi:hypothetical protein BJ138DRAFT_128952 [Hygrophoropsis aurantiaca]|uniref:Uncharacterized protein n=1 Tax=Hygrophoropsis aurantiaca TaxID=72124 RepID=A0ACB7ZR33_9AGAM|nr:hypothetical protein BJ138DRAFT_128952 [Hygrophoropsis aurantiaca]